MKHLHSFLTWVIAALCILGLTWAFLHRLDSEWAKEDAVLAEAEAINTITAILQQDKKAIRLIDAWPEAPTVMLMVAEKYKIDRYLLPCISRAEGPTPAMLKAHNIYGLEYKGKLLEFIDHYSATDAAAELLAKHKGKYQSTGLVDIEKLAGIWCPANAGLWADNVKNIYLKALK